MTKVNDNMIKSLENSRRIIKYILMGFIILVACRYIPDQPIQTNEIVMIYSKNALDALNQSSLDKNQINYFNAFAEELMVRTK